MGNNRSFQKMAGLLAILAGVFALLSLIVGLAGVNYNFDVFSDPSSLIALGTAAAPFIQWSYWLNMFGNYLLLIPLALLLYQWLEPPNNNLFAQLYTLSGLSYMLLGAAGSAILAAAWPLLMARYAGATAAEQLALTLDFQTVTAIAETGLHGVIQNLCGAIWLLGMGAWLRQKWSAAGIAAMIVGFFLLLNTLGNMLQIEALSLIGLMANIIVGPLWSIWVGSLLLQRNLTHEKGVPTTEFA